MGILIDGGRIPPRWAEKAGLRPAMSNYRRRAETECIRIAFINNMPDPALEDTEMQFFDLLASAAGEHPVRLKLYSLPRVPRGDRGQQHLNSFYFGVDDLWNSRFDALIMTGTEPRQPDLSQEPYWPALTEVLDWAERNTISTVLSCLAAHAGVLHADGIPRHALGDKKFGVFESVTACDHELTRHTVKPMRFPHSRWNEVREDALTSCGYTVLAKSEQAGVDLFVKERGKSLFVHFQGHPEYGAQTLLKEYRRDIKRFLRKERATYPTMPQGYFDPPAVRLLNKFQQEVVREPREEKFSLFPGDGIAEGMQNTWKSSASGLYRNWLQYVLSRKSDASPFSVMAASAAEADRKRSAVS